MSRHLPEAVHRAGRYAHIQLGQVAFQERPDEFLAPLVAGGVRLRQEAEWEAASPPVGAQHASVESWVQIESMVYNLQVWICSRIRT